MRASIVAIWVMVALVIGAVALVTRGDRTLNRLLAGEEVSAIQRIELASGGKVAWSDDPVVLTYFYEMLRRSRTLDDDPETAEPGVPHHAGTMTIDFGFGNRTVRSIYSRPDGRKFDIFTWLDILQSEEMIYVAGVEDDAPPGVIDLFRVFEREGDQPEY